MPGFELMGYGLYTEDEKDYAIKIFKSIDRTYENFASSGRLTNDEKRGIGSVQQLLKENYLDRYDRSSLVYKMAKEYFNGYRAIREGNGLLNKAAYDPDDPESWELKLPGAELLDTSYGNIQPESVSPGAELLLPSNGNADIVKRYSNIGCRRKNTGQPSTRAGNCGSAPVSGKLRWVECADFAHTRELYRRGAFVRSNDSFAAVRRRPQGAKYALKAAERGDAAGYMEEAVSLEKRCSKVFNISDTARRGKRRVEGRGRCNEGAGTW
jgi:hypothetical protein